ncbi:lysozyme [Ruegeria sp. MALMAid1280]|uniref:lysozyme n=1 Tax=Ruegeria sp. MALMAid1280 TaxID=3411634 RepID=UPI003B9DD7F9
MTNLITPNVAAELISHEGIVREAYRDSVGVWTWSIGITSSSGHKVWPRYVDNPQSLKRCFEVFEWVVRNNYLPAVQQAFAGHTLTEAQLGAALSFHYNTGGIKKATWVKRWKAGDVSGAKKAIMNWKKPEEIIPRRKKEQALFFEGVWSNNGTGTEYKVRKPSYLPDWSSATSVSTKAILDDLFG